MSGSGLEDEDEFIKPDKGLDISDEDDEDERKHRKMLAAIGALDAKKKIQEGERFEAGASVSELHIGAGDDKVGLHQLVRVLHRGSGHGDLKKQLNRVQNKHVVPTPLSRPQQERIERSVIYKETSKEVSKWQPIVEENRKAEQLQFPLEKPDLRLVTSQEFVKRFQPRTPLEMEVASILQGSQKVSSTILSLSASEKKASKAMNLEKAKERRAELQRYRALLSYKESRAHRQKKIKSKRYHRILKKEKLKQEKQTLDELQRTDPEAFLERLKKLDTNRVQERMNLKHRGGSKYMMKQKLFAKYDDKARQSVQEMLQKSRELTKKAVVESESDDSDLGETEELESESKANLVSAANPWMAKQRVKSTTPNKPPIPEAEESETVISKTTVSANIATGKRAQSSTDVKMDEQNLQDYDIEDIFKEGVPNRSPSKVKAKTKSKRKSKAKLRKLAKEKTKKDDLESDSDGEAASAELKTETMTTGKGSGLIASLTRKRTLEDFDGEGSESDSEENDTRERQSSESIQEKQPSDAGSSTKSREIKVDPKKFFTVEKKLGMECDDGERYSDDNEEDEQRLIIAQAFAADDVLNDFETEKNLIAERDKPKDIDLSLPGWGSWGGTGVKPSKKKRKRFLIKAPPAPPRKDRNLDNVIISERKDTTVAKHQVRDLPFPFTNVAEFEKSIRAPIGKTWNAETAYRELIKPKVVTQMGAVITPIDKAQLLKKGQAKQDATDKPHGSRTRKNKKKR